VASSGLNTLRQMISPSSMAMMRTSPAAPGPTKANQTGQPASSVPEVSMTLWRPNLAASRRDSREPIRPPTHGTVKATPYCQGA
jgi:hypothetical protein